MFQKLLLSVFILLSSFLYADIVEIVHIDEVRPYISQKNALCLFDVDDTLIDNPFNLGSPPWRNWVKAKLPQNSQFALFDALTLYIAKNAPYKAVEPATPRFIEDLQKSGVTAFGFTARGRSEWYTTTVDGVDRFTHHQLNRAGIDFKQTPVPEALQSLEPAYFDQGIIFAQHIAKGDLLKILFKEINYKPSLIIFVDDKLEQVKSVEASLKESGIPFIGFWYRRSEMDRRNFSPLATTIQLQFLLEEGVILNDQEAQDLALLKEGVDPHTYLMEILSSIDQNVLVPMITD